MKILSVLDTIGGNDGLGVKRLAELVKLKVPCVHNILQTLLHLGYIEQTDSSKYRITNKTKYLGCDGQKKENLLQIVRPALQRLASETNETCLLAVRSGNQWQMLLQMECCQPLSARHNLPITDNFYISATGRCMLASFRQPELLSFLQEHRLPSEYEWKGVGSLRQLEEKLAGIREKRFEIYHPEQSGVTGIAVPLQRNKNCSDAALGIIVPDFRFNEKYKENLIARMLRTAEQINQKIILL